MIKKAIGYQTDDGKMWSSLNEAAGHIYGKRLRDVLGKQSVFGVSTLIDHSREVAEILNEYNAEMDKLDAEPLED